MKLTEIKTNIQYIVTVGDERSNMLSTGSRFIVNDGVFTRKDWHIRIDISLYPNVEVDYDKEWIAQRKIDIVDEFRLLNGLDTDSEISKPASEWIKQVKRETLSEAVLMHRLYSEPDPRARARNDYEKASELGLTSLNRWEDGIEHHPLSERLVRFLGRHDTYDYDNHFDWKVGGDGDNGESLMYQMDAFFEMLEKQ